MAQPPPAGPRPTSEALSHPPGAPREPDTAGCTVCPPSVEEKVRPAQPQGQGWGQDPLGPPEHFQDSAPMLPAPPCEDPAGDKHLERPLSGREVLKAEQDSLHLYLLGLGLRLQDLERGLGPRMPAQSGMVQLQALQADLHGAAERVDALLAFGEGLAQQSEPQARASLEQALRTLGAHRDGILWRLWQLQAQLVSYSLVFEEANTLDEDLEVDTNSDGPMPGGVCGPWAPSSPPASAELEWDPSGDVGGLGPLGRKKVWTPRPCCELCGHRGLHGREQGLKDMFMPGLSHRKHFADHQRHSLLRKSQVKKRRASPDLQDVRLEVDPGVPAPASRWPLTFFLLLLFFLLVGATMLLPKSGGPCCSPAQLVRTPHLLLSYVNGPPPV